MFKKKNYPALAACLGMMLGASAQANDLGYRYLAIDQTLHGQLIDSQMVLGQTTNAQKMTIVNEPWKVANDVRARPITSVFVDHNGAFRMYYAVSGGGNSATAMALSNDGINWTLPALNGDPALFNHPDANVINLPHHTAMGSNGYGGATVFLDPSAPASQRYKLVWTTANSTYGAVSEDGINFSNSNLLFTHRNEHVVSAFYDVAKGEYAMYGRIRGDTSWNLHGGTIVDDQRRGAAGHFTSGNFMSSWTNVGVTVLDPEDIWDYTDGWTPGNNATNTGIRPDFYNPGIFQYHGQYIGLPSTYYRDAERVSHQRPDRYFGTGPQYPTLMHGHDGVNFTLADESLVDAHPFFDPSVNLRINPHPDSPFTDPNLASGHPDAANWTPWTHDDQGIPELGQIHAAPGYLQVTPEKMLFYHFQRPDTHYLGWGGDTSPGGDSEHNQWVSELRTDGFASIKANQGEVGEWRTTNVEVPELARGLLVNADVAGSLKVEVLDSNGNVITNLSLDDSVAFTGDSVSELMKWSAGQFEQVAGQTVQLRFVVEDGEIYSFSFSPIPEPASLMLLGLGGAMMLRRRRTHA